MFIDIDEFVVLRRSKDIHTFVEGLNPELGGMISMNWKFCGSSGIQNYTSELVVKRFQRCQKGVDTRVKSIIHTPDIIGDST